MHISELRDRLLTWPLYILPHKLLSQLVRRLTRIRAAWWKDSCIRLFIWHFKVDMSEAAIPDPGSYPDFNSFFTRALGPGQRQLPVEADGIACPVDGCISQIGVLENDTLLQAKGHHYTLRALLGDDAEMAARFRNGLFATLYLSPRDYHRIHMPLDGSLSQTVYLPGRLFSVAPRTTRTVPGLFTRNERLVCQFETAHGPLAVILVGALFVSCMETSWAGTVNPRMRMKQYRTVHGTAADSEVRLARGEELGRFNMGSTVILLFANRRAIWNPDQVPDQRVRMGQLLGTTC